MVKCDLNKTFVEGILSTDTPTTARPAFRRFYEKVYGQFNIDGRIFSFSPIDDLTDITTSPGSVIGGIFVPGSNYSTKRYRVDLDFIKKAIDGERVVVKMNSRNEFVEGVFSDNSDLYAKAAFTKFYNKMNSKE